jgi:hypothetical protein
MDAELKSGSPHVRKPVMPLAWLAVGLAFVAIVLALYGSFLSEVHLPGSRLNAARKQPGLPDANPDTIRFAAYYLPFALGIAATLAGGQAMRSIEARGRIHAGSRHSVFAIMIGGLAAVVAGCMIFVTQVWPRLAE